MQYVNDDMDNVFRRAAENYPLKTSGADWDKIAGALQEKGSVINSKERKSYNKYPKFLLLILFIPLPFLCNKYFKIGPTNGTSDITSGKVDFSQGSKQEFKKGKESSELSYTNPDSKLIEPEPLNTVSKIPVQKLFTSKNNISTVEEMKKADNGEFNHIPFENKNHTTTPAKDKDKVQEVAMSDRASAADDLVSITSGAEEIQDSSKEEIQENDSLALKPQNHKGKKFYAGIVGGADLTTVKFQKISDIGYGAGIILGYDLNSHWSIEAGVLTTKKFYYTRGEYFSTYKLNLPGNTKIKYVDGNCQMIEIPVAVKYSFNSTAKNGWFVTAGVSSLLMKKENYDYMYLYLNSGNQVNHFKSYKNSSKDWISTFQLSGGYTFSLKQMVDIRFEPYVQLPIKSVGYGDLPLNSAGLRIGITKKLF